MKQLPPDDGNTAPDKGGLGLGPQGLQIESIESGSALDDEFASESEGDVERHDVPPPPSANLTAASAPAAEETRVRVVVRHDATVSTQPEPGPDETLSIAELLENDTPVEWPEAVAIAEQICEAIEKQALPGAQEYVLDAHHIAITERGDVRVRPGGPGGDPVVRQVGRILRALLERSAAPAALRLLASHASLELPGFATVGELAEALRSFKKNSHAETIQTAFRRGRDTRPAPPPPVATPPISPPPPVLGRAIRAAPALVDGPPRFAIRQRLPAIVLGLLLCGLAYVVITTLTAGSPAVTTEREIAFIAETTRRAGAASPPTPTARQDAAAPRRAAAGAEPASRLRESGPTPARTAPSAAPPASSAGSTDPQSLVTPSAGPRSDEVQRLFDRIVLIDPLYTLTPERSTPDAVAALRDSKRVLVPDIARRDLARARAAFEAGAYEQAGTEAGRVMRMLDDLDADVSPPGLSEATRELLARIETARARDDQRVYSEADAGVTPPEALSRQLPMAPPNGVSKGQVGTLEMVISRSGQVEVIKLHTPQNRYHERMIVSAAKAWRYKPAVKDGRPVRYRLISSINLPES